MLYFYIALLAIALTWLWNKSGAGKTVVTLAILGIMTIGAAGSVQRMRLDGWGHYQNAVAYMKQHAGPNDLVVGSQELGFLLGFTPNFRDDWGIRVAHGRAPRFIFMEDIYTERYQTEMIQKTPEYPAAIERLKEYKPVFQDEGFKVWSGAGAWQAKSSQMPGPIRTGDCDRRPSFCRDPCGRWS